MAKPLFDADALISMFQNATSRQGAQLQKAAGDATLAALQGRELTLKNIRSTLKAVSDAASQGAAKNAVPGMDPETLLDAAVAGMDDAMLKAVDANRAALQQFVTQGADLREKHLKKALEQAMAARLNAAGGGAAAPASAAGPKAATPPKAAASGAKK